MLSWERVNLWETNMREEYMRVSTPDERAVARDFLLEYAAPEEAGLLPQLEQWDWPGMPPSWLRVELGGRAYFVW